MIASKLQEGYFTESFDAVEQALSELPSDPNPRYLEDRVAEKLLTLQMLNERLYAHIMENYGDFVGGIEVCMHELYIGSFVFLSVPPNVWVWIVVQTHTHTKIDI